MTQLPPARVKKLQEMLNNVVKPRPELEPDGIFGPLTKTALKSLQKAAGIQQTGEVDADTAIVIARVQKTGKIAKDPPTRFYRVNGKWVGMTEREYQRARKKLIADLQRGPLRQMMLNVGALEHEWQLMHDLNSDQWFVSTCIEATRGVSLPPKSICAQARRAYLHCNAALKSGDLLKFQRMYPASEKIVNDNVDQMRKYRAEMIEGGGNWVTNLRFTKTASFTFVGVFAAPVAGATLGTGVVASAMISGAAVSATQTASSEFGHWAAGTPNWSAGGAIKNTVVDAGVGAIIGYFTKGAGGGKGLIEAASARVFCNLARQTGYKLLSATTLKKIAVFLLTEGAKKALEDAVKDAAMAVKGDKKMTLEKFIDNVAVNFLKGATMAPIGKVIGAFASKASSRLSSSDRSQIFKLVLQEVAKQSKGRTKHISEIDKRTQALVEKVIDVQVAKVLDQIVGDVYDKWKGPMSPAGFEKAIRKRLLSPATARPIATAAAKEVNRKSKVPTG